MSFNGRSALQSVPGSAVVKDLHFAVRILLKTPGLTLAIVFSIAVGIAANTTVFSIINALRFGALPVREPDRLVSFGAGKGFSYPDYEYYRDQTQVFKGISACFPLVPVSIGGGEPERIWGQLVSANYFEVLGLQPALGRGFLPGEDEVPDGSPVTVISDGLWRRRFGADRDTLGKTVLFNDRRYTVVGILPPGFAGENRGFISEFWVPLSMIGHLLPQLAEQNPTINRDVSLFALTARLKPGVSREQAQTAVNVVHDRIEAQHRSGKRTRPPVELTDAGRLLRGVERRTNPLMAALMALASLVLLIACANVANILLARATGRRREIGMRLVLGATRTRLVRQLLTESFLLASLSAVVGVLLAGFATRAMSQVRLPIPLPFRFDFTLDGRVLLFTVVLTMLTGILLGILPAFRTTKPGAVAALKDETGVSGSLRWFGLRQILVVPQIALSIILLASAGLFLRSIGNASSIDLGMRTDNLLLMAFDPKLHSYSSEQSRQFIRQLRERVTALPGIDLMSFVDLVPLSIGSQATRFSADGPAGDRNPGHQADMLAVGSNYFATMGIPLQRGRDFDSARDIERRAAIINNAMARRLFGDEDPLGRTIVGRGDTYEVIGIAGDTKSRTLGERRRSCMYRFVERDPDDVSPLLGVTLVAKTFDDPKLMVGSVRQQIHSLDPNLAVFNIKTMQEQVSEALLIPRLSAILLSVFGSMGLVVAMVGLYAVVSYSVRQRTREIGIRMALGAQGGEVLRAILKQGMLLAGVGVAVGLGGAAAISRLFSSFLYGISSTDPFTFVAVPLLLLLIAFLAILLPGHRASQVAPSVALRYE